MSRSLHRIGFCVYPLLFCFLWIVLSGSTTTTAMRTKNNVYDELQAIIGTDAGDRGMKTLIVERDLELAAKALGKLTPKGHILVLSGFPCCVHENPPTETDGPPGTYAIARAAAALGHDVTVVTDDCNQAVFAAALDGLSLPEECGNITLETFPAVFSGLDEERFARLAKQCTLLISCERAGPGKDGNCYTMRGIDMTAKGLIAPLHRFVEECDCPMVSIGDGGNELGMGKVLPNIIHNEKIRNGDRIGCVVAADFLVAASVSNWGGYALAAAAALAHTEDDSDTAEQWIERCLPTEDDERSLLDRCVAAGCRDGVSGKQEATVDGMPLETSLQCLRDIRATALSNK